MSTKFGFLFDFEPKFRPKPKDAMHTKTEISSETETEMHTKTEILAVTETETQTESFRSIVSAPFRLHFMKCKRFDVFHFYKL
jgi:hypothetical protein